MANIRYYQQKRKDAAKHRNYGSLEVELSNGEKQRIHEFQGGNGFAGLDLLAFEHKLRNSKEFKIAQNDDERGFIVSEMIVDLFKQQFTFKDFDRKMSSLENEWSMFDVKIKIDMYNDLFVYDQYSNEGFSGIVDSFFNAYKELGEEVDKSEKK
jgi:hypothetical protein